MLIEIRCPNGHVLHVKDKHAGKIGACPRCSAPVRVPLVGELQGDSRFAGGAADRRQEESALQHDSRYERSTEGVDSSSSSFWVTSKGKRCLGCGKDVSVSFSICSRCGTPVPTYRQLTVRREGDAIVIQFLKGRILDDATVRETADELNTVADLPGQRDLVLSMSKVVAVSSLMLGKLVMLQKKMEQQHRRLRLCNIGSEVREVLAATRLDQILLLSDTEEQALKSLISDSAQSGLL